MSGPVWVNGALMDPSVAALSVFDHGVTVGDGVFETMLSYADTGLAFARQHLVRLRSSAAGLALTVPFDDDSVGSAALPSGGVHVDDSLKVTYWQSGMDDALAY